MSNLPDCDGIPYEKCLFEMRQKAWKGHKRTFRQLNGRQDRPNVWEIWVEGDRYFTRHGLLGGAMQETNKLGKLKNKGKINQISPEMDALAEARRLCRKKFDFEGYDEFVGETNLDNRLGKPAVNNLLFPLPGNFSLYKPGNNIAESSALLSKVEQGQAWFTLKRNGMAVWVVVDEFRVVQIYSRRNRAWHKNEGPEELADGTLNYGTSIPLSARYYHLYTIICNMNLPPNTLLACELVNALGDSKEHFAHVQSVEKSLTNEAIRKQEESGFLKLYCWDIPFYDGKDLVSTCSVGDRYRLIHELTNKLELSKEWILPIQIWNFKTIEQATEYAKTNNLEGWVVVDPNGIYGDKGWNLKGKPDRPSSLCAKLKPWFEDDFIVQWDPSKKWGTHGKGKHEKGKLVTLPNGEQVIHGGVGSVGLFQFDINGMLTYICDCSSGMDYEFQAKLTKDSFPFVAEIKYVDRSYISDGDATNALTFPSFVRARTDKVRSECYDENL